jgi:hypothetical protein
MASLKDMAEAHLLNVQREIQQLQERKTSIDQEIERLSSYLTEGKQTLEQQNTVNVEQTVPQSQTFLGDNYGK